MSVRSPSDPGSADPTRQPMALPAPVNPALLTALTTEHFTLQGARAATISESSSRSALYISAVASSLVALGFVAQLSKVGDAFHAFAFTVLPTLFVLGLFTWVRLTENGVEDLQYLRAINRIRGYYLKIEPDSAHYFMMSAQEDAASMMASQGHAATTIEVLFTFASMIAVINSVILAAIIALAVASVLGAAPGAAIGAGGIGALGSILLHLRREVRVFATVLFPAAPSERKPQRRRFRLR